MRLYMVRHAQPLTGDDASPLSPGGQRQADQLAALFPQFALAPKRVAILTTKFRRARQTAERIGQGLGLEPDRVVGLPDTALPPGDNFLRQFLVQHVREHAAEGWDAILLVGHGPYFRILFDWFLGPGTRGPEPRARLHRLPGGKRRDSGRLAAPLGDGPAADDV